MSSVSIAADLAMLADAVESDPGLSSIEKEFIVRVSHADDALDVFCEIPSVVRRLVRNPSFDAEKWRILDDDGVTMIDDDETDISALVDDGASIVGVWGSAPIGSLSIKSTPRTSDEFRRIVATE